MDSDNKVVLCGANAYEQKYYFNKDFDKIPLEFGTEYAPEDYLYDEISAGLLVRKIRDTRQDLLQSLSLYYRVLFLHEDIEGLMED